MTELTSGIRYLLAGFGLITKPGIRLFVVIPLLVNVVLFASAIAFGAHLIGGMIDWIAAQWAWAEYVTWLLWPIFVIIALAVVFFCFTIIANLIAAPFNGMLAEAVESYLTTASVDSQTTWRELPGEIVASLKSEGHKFLYFMIRALPLLILFIIPVIQAAAPFIWFLFGAWMLSLEYLDYPLGNHGKRFVDIRQIVASKRALSTGFGIAALSLSLIPVLNFIAMPVAVAGATKLALERLDNT